ncbi:MAG: hypothetical protein ABW048_00670 [Sphingobium sp.]
MTDRWHLPPMHDERTNPLASPDAALLEIRRASRIMDDLNDRIGREALQRYIDELEAFVLRSTARIDWQY